VITDFVTQSGGKIVDEIYVPVDARMQDFKRFRKQVETLKPDAIISTVVGHGVQMLYEAYADAGFDPETMPIASTTTTEAEISAMKPGVATGHLSSLPFFDTIGTEAAIRFIEAYKRRFGPEAPVNAAAEAAYFQVFIYAKALEAGGTDDPDEIAKRIEGMEYDAPQGRVRVDAGNHHTDLWPRIGKINTAGRFDLVWESKVSVRPDPYFVAASSDEWSSDMSVLSV
jgi:branched-chain amino acid transport system substrate-binding protein